MMLRTVNSVVLIGCGGIGSWLLAPLLRFLNAEAFVGEFALWDGDRYTADNCTRQEFSRKTLGEFKAEAQAEHHKNDYPALHLRAHNDFVTAENVRIAIPDSSIVVSAVDNHPARTVIERQALSLRNICVLSAGNERLDGNVHVLLRSGGRTLTLPNIERHPEVAIASAGDRSRIGCEELVRRGETQLLVTNYMAAAATFALFHRVWPPRRARPGRKSANLPQEVFFDAGACAMSMVPASMGAGEE